MSEDRSKLGFKFGISFDSSLFRCYIFMVSFPSFWKFQITQFQICSFVKLLVPFQLTLLCFSTWINSWLFGSDYFFIICNKLLFADNCTHFYIQSELRIWDQLNRFQLIVSEVLSIGFISFLTVSIFHDLFWENFLCLESLNMLF